ncbi:rhomboid family intramembrane serine protease [Paenirhodobacter sp.]|uniref:rhomboid family intramembrane serine protease n=1 Tax=Paenirhodobacter sp. TaxID=1965326 RepID=UPI003B409878
MQPGQHHQVINPLPPVVWLLAGPIIAGEILFGLGQTGLVGDLALGWRLDALQRFAFDPEILRQMVIQNTWPWKQVARIVTYPFVHGSMMHAVMVLVFLLALGKMVGEVFRGWAVAAVFFGATIAGALVYAALPFTRGALYGGYPAAYGLIGAFTWLLWMKLGMANANRGRAFMFIGLLMAVRLVFGLLFGVTPDWIADFTGFGAGFLLSFFVAPGGWRNVLAMLRRR